MGKRTNAARAIAAAHESRRWPPLACSAAVITVLCMGAAASVRAESVAPRPDSFDATRCPREQAAGAQANQPLTARNKVLLLRFIAAINSWDFDAIREMLHEEITWELPYAPATFPRLKQGSAAVMEFLESVPSFVEAENLSDVTIEAYASDPNELVMQYRSDMKLVSGAKYANTYIVRATICDGRIRRFSEYFDPIPLIEALGGRVELVAPK